MYPGIDLSPGSSALVIQGDDGGVVHYEHFREDNTKRDLRARFRMAERVWFALQQLSYVHGQVDLIALEDYALGKGENVSYQIAEVAACLKYRILENKIPLVLVNPRKLKSYVLRKRDVPKEVVIAWAAEKGFNPPEKLRGLDGGFYKREREDLSDAFVLSTIAREVYMHISEGSLPKAGDIILDPQNGLAFRKDLLFNNHFAEEWEHDPTI